MRKTMLAALAVISLSVAGCDHMTQQQQRALSGGALGAAGGAAIGAITGVNPWVLGTIGAAGGAAAGALTK